jgi:DNA-binding response OmpR family regulator
VRVLVVEPALPLMRILERGLRAHGYEVVGTDTADHGVALANDPLIRCVVVDSMLPGTTGHAVRDRIRAQKPSLPVIVLTSRDDPVADDTDSTHSAEDYLPKPFAFEELIALIHARTRGATERRMTTLSVGDLRLDLLARCAWRGEHFIDLPSREFALLEYFMRHAGRVLTRQAILADVWGYDYDAGSDSNLVDVYVRYVRNKIDRPGSRPLIKTVRGEGYRFESAVAEPELVRPPHPARASPASPRGRGE